MKEYAISFIHPDTVGWQFVSSLMNTLLSPGPHTPVAVFERRAGPNTAPYRNEQIQRFLQTPTEWLLCVDADMVWNPQDIWTLLDQADPIKRPIIGGLAFELYPQVRPVLYNLKQNPLEFVKLKPKKTPGLQKVDLVGLAFSVFHRSVFEKIGDPYFSYNHIEAVDDENTGFSCRIQDLGIPVYIDTRIKIGHLRLRPISAEDYES